MTKEIDLDEVIPYFRALNCDVRWQIIRLLKEPKSSDELFTIIKEGPPQINAEDDNCEGKCKLGPIETLKKPTLYYHLRELEKVGLIEVVKLKPSEHGRAPEKVWKSNINKLIINL